MSTRTPLSIEEILEKQRQEKEATSKPKFISKAERAAIALAKRAAEVEAAQEKKLATTQARDDLDRGTRNQNASNAAGSGSRYGDYQSQGQGQYQGGGQWDGRDGGGGGLNYGPRGGGGRQDYGHRGRGGYNDRGRGGGRGGSGLGYNDRRGPPGGDLPNNVPTGPRGSQQGGRGGGRGGYDSRGGGDRYDGGRRDERYQGGGDRRDERRDDRNGPRDQRNPPPPRDSPAPAGAVKAESDRSTPVPMQVDSPTPAPPTAEDVKPPPPTSTDDQDTKPPPPSTEAPPPPPSDDSIPPPPPPPSSMPPPPPPAPKVEERSPTPPPAPKLTLAEMAAQQALMAAPAPLNATLNATRYLGAKAPDKRKIRKTSDKKFVFDWDRTDDTGADEVDPLYAPYIPRTAPPKGNGPDRRNNGGGGGSTYGVKTDDRQRQIVPAQVVGQPPKIGMYGRGMLAGFDREAIPGKKGEKKVKGAIDERHWSDKTLDEMKERDWRIFREDFSISARGGQIPLPLRSWKESNIPQQLMDVIEEIGYTEPSPIQRQAIPIGLMNRDQIGIAETGSGKTAAFVVPMLAYISRLPPLSDENRAQGPYALVLAPTRELAQQIESETNKFTKLLGYKCVSIVGGRAIEEQQFNMRDGAEIVIATPGRLKDCIERHVLVLGQCTYVVMDEADRMVSLGFEDVINFILDALPVSNLKPDTAEAEDGEKMSMVINAAEGDESAGSTLALYRQTVMFSATMPAAVERLAKKYLRRPAIVTIGVAGQAVDTVEQRVEFVSGDDKKKARLVEILNTGGFDPPMIVFVNQKKGADVLMKDLQRAHWNATSLHSGKNQEQREAALNSIRNGECDVLVATDLAGRGIDVPDVSLVVNFQMANNIEAYVHRIGRTGRAGRTGVAITFLNDADEELMYDLKSLIAKSPVSRMNPELLKHPAAQTKITSAMKRQIED